MSMNNECLTDCLYIDKCACKTCIYVSHRSTTSLCGCSIRYSQVVEKCDTYKEDFIKKLIYANF